MPAPYGLLSRRLGVDGFERQRHFNQFFLGIHVHPANATITKKISRRLVIEPMRILRNGIESILRIYADEHAFALLEILKKPTSKSICAHVCQV
jgi:hypothetical protein